MKTLYLDCSMGAAGDMLAAALLELLPEGEAADFIGRMNGLGIPGVSVEREPARKCGILGSRFAVRIHGEAEGEPGGHEQGHGAAGGPGEGHEHRHRGMGEIARIIEGLPLPEGVRRDVLQVYGLVAQAESHAHGTPVEEVHFHELGAMDAIADITAVCLLMHRLSPDRVIASPVHVGSGELRCAHGILPVPAPATARILMGVPIYGGRIRGELCTPTGAALLKHFADEFGDMPALCTQAIGYGMGTKDFETANCLRAMLGETEEGLEEHIYALSCNVDDMRAEGLGFALERLLEAGALDVFTLPAGMKKSRPGTLLCVLCRGEDRQRLLPLIFRHTSTLGVRETACRRYMLSRDTVTLDTPYGPVRRKDAAGYGLRRSKYEYEDLARIARERGLSLGEAAALLDGGPSEL